MKKIIAIALTALLTAALMVPAFAEPVSKNVLNGTPELDGKLDEIYKNSASVKLENLNFYVWGDVSETDSDATAYFLWDESFLYYCVEVKDSTPTKPEESETWQNDAVEMWFDDGEMKYKIHAALDGAFFVGSDADGDVPYDFTKAHAFSAEISGGYGIEVALPFNNLKAGRTFVSTMQVNDITDASHENGSAHGYQIGNISGDEDTWTYTLSADKVAAAPADPDRGAASLGNVPQSYADINVDAQMDDIYNEALKLDISRPLTDGQDETGCHGTGWLLYKDGWLYEYAEITDPQLFDPDPDKQQNTPWETDSLELFVNVKNSEDSTDVMQYRIDCQGWPCVYDQNGVADYGPDAVGSTFKYAERAINGGYAVEFAVPLNVAEGAHVSFQNQINDRYDDDQSQVQWMTPSSLNSSSWTAELYDYIVIGAMLTPPAVEAAPAPAAEAAPAAAAPAAAAPAPAAAAAAPAAAPVAEAAPAAAAPAVQTGDSAALIVLAAVAALGTAVVIGKKH